MTKKIQKRFFEKVFENSFFYNSDIYWDDEWNEEQRSILQEFKINELFNNFSRRFKTFISEFENIYDEEVLLFYLVEDLTHKISNEYKGQVYFELPLLESDVIQGKISYERYKGNLVFFIKELNKDLFNSLEYVIEEDDKSTKAVKIPQYFHIDSILDDVFRKYEYLFGKNPEAFKEKIRKMEKRFKEMSGKPLSPENKKMYLEILDIQKENLTDSGPGHRAGLSQAIRNYGKKNKKRWNPEEVHSILETIRQLLKKGRLKK